MFSLGCVLLFSASISLVLGPENSANPASETSSHRDAQLWQRTASVPRQYIYNKQVVSKLNVWYLICAKVHKLLNIE